MFRVGACRINHIECGNLAFSPKHTVNEFIFLLSNDSKLYINGQNTGALRTNSDRLL